MIESRPEVLAGSSVVQAVREAARAAAPIEACGLLLGRAEPDRFVLTACVPSQNIASDPVRRFEVDPAVRLRVQREARAGGEPMIGLYHSHPAGSAAPSAVDRRCLHEPGLVWLITGPDPGWEIRVWLALTDDFRELPLIVADA
jgi:proteasome lid subunit RPN8/RPN11